MEKKNFFIRYLITDTYVASYMTTAAPRFNSSRHVVATILLNLKVRYRRYSEIVIGCFILKVSEIWPTETASDSLKNDVTKKSMSQELKHISQSFKKQWKA